VDSFIEKFGGSISSTLECFDRVIFKGHLPFQNEARLNGFVDHVLKIRRKDFLKLLERHCNDLVAVLCVQETCKTVRLVHAQGRPVLVHARRPQRVLYFYYLDRDFGLMYVRIQSGRDGDQRPVRVPRPPQAGTERGAPHGVVSHEQERCQSASCGTGGPCGQPAVSRGPFGRQRPCTVLLQGGTACRATGRRPAFIRRIQSGPPRRRPPVRRRARWQQPAPWLS